MEDNNNFRAFEYARDFQEFENSLKIESKSTYLEMLIESKSEIEYLSKYFANIVEISLEYIEHFFNEKLEENESKDETSKLITLIMVVLYNYRHISKIVEEKHVNDKTAIHTKKSRITSNFKQTIKTIETIVTHSPNLGSFLKLSKLSESTIESASNIFSVLNPASFLDHPEIFPSFTKQITNMLHSTSLA